MDVLICVADGLLAGEIDYGDRIEQHLARAGLTCARYDLTSPVACRAIPGLGYVFTGGQTSVHATAAWMRAAIDFMRHRVADARNAGPAVVGVCLGAQLIAEALRPGSIVGTSGIEVGLTRVNWVRQDDHDDAAGSGVEVVPAFHYQAISPLIEEIAGTRIQARNEHTAVQAFSYGERVFGCQFHPELSPADMHQLIDYNSGVITQWRGNVGASHRSVERYQGSLRDDLFTRMVTARIRPDRRR